MNKLTDNDNPSVTFSGLVRITARSHRNSDRQAPINALRRSKTTVMIKPELPPSKAEVVVVSLMGWAEWVGSDSIPKTSSSTSIGQ
ncbi:hypothetical protein AX774_g7318 [Zancudomyces culisetae]|uniref:Uncharacterized protein n=1 Tax=Zancudomyces culisetae TaxID=1213189 RepID=A0A1R1PEC4_ZANCU|nr:hypothetical protein AX774_g8044 [Zancudomyces culisetae]OMH79268.1 hypothetical protein AX774_g7318 [Zancudomyces culisetae]|eukprot:OMH78555.1 hypothetical protein AX774_g8044 [Zancudomyces culisetae]